jgi:hypothetical protein
MTVDGVPVAAIGTLTWVGKDEGFPVLPFIGLGLLAILALLGAVVLRRKRHPDEPEDPSGSRPEAW